MLKSDDVFVHVAPAYTTSVVYYRLTFLFAFFDGQCRLLHNRKKKLLLLRMSNVQRYRGGTCTAHALGKGTRGHREKAFRHGLRTWWNGWGFFGVGRPG